MIAKIVIVFIDHDYSKATVLVFRAVLNHVRPKYITRCVWFFTFAIKKIILMLMFKLDIGDYNGDLNNTNFNDVCVFPDSMSYLQSLNVNPFKSYLSSLVFCIRSILLCLRQSEFNIQFLWVPIVHEGIHGNEITDTLAKFSLFLSSSYSLIPWPKFSSFLRRHIFNH